MTASEAAEHLGDLLDVCATSHASAAITQVGRGSGRGATVDIDKALCFVLATLCYCIELLDPDGVPEEPYSAVQGILLEGMYGCLQ